MQVHLPNNTAKPYYLQLRQWRESISYSSPNPPDWFRNAHSIPASMQAFRSVLLISRSRSAWSCRKVNPTLARFPAAGFCGFRPPPGARLRVFIDFGMIVRKLPSIRKGFGVVKLAGHVVVPRFIRSAIYKPYIKPRRPPHEPAHP